MALDATSLPSHLQTVSSENIITDYNAVQSTANQNIQQTLNQQQQILALAQQSLMESAFGAAMADPGLLEKAGSGIGGIARGLIGLPAPVRRM